jgi:uncharacterized XkdX family phage protein
MFERIKRLFEAKEITIDGLKKAVEKGLITEDQFTVISGQDYE